MSPADQAFLYRLADEMSRAPFAPVVKIRGGIRLSRATARKVERLLLIERKRARTAG